MPTLEEVLILMRHKKDVANCSRRFCSKHPALISFVKSAADPTALPSAPGLESRTGGRRWPACQIDILPPRLALISEDKLRSRGDAWQPSCMCESTAKSKFIGALRRLFLHQCIKNWEEPLPVTFVGLKVQTFWRNNLTASTTVIKSSRRASL